MSTKSLDLNEYGIKEPVVLKSVSYRDYKEFENASKASPEDDKPTLTLLLKAIKEAPFDHTTVDDLEKLDLEVLAEVELGLFDMLRPLLEKMQRRTSGGSGKPSDPDGPKTQPLANG